MRWIRGILFLFVCLFTLSCGTISRANTPDSAENPYYITTVQNVTMTPFTIVVRMKNKKRNNIRYHQTLGVGQTSIPMRLKKGVEYELYGWCVVCGQSVKMYFMNAMRLRITEHNCTDIGDKKQRPRRYGA